MADEVKVEITVQSDSPEAVTFVTRSRTAGDEPEPNGPGSEGGVIGDFIRLKVEDDGNGDRRVRRIPPLIPVKPDSIRTISLEIHKDSDLDTLFVTPILGNDGIELGEIFVDPPVGRFQLDSGVPRVFLFKSDLDIKELTDQAGLITLGFQYRDVDDAAAAPLPGPNNGDDTSYHIEC